MKNEKISPTKQSQKKKDNITIIVLSALAVILIAVLAIMVLNFTGDDSSSDVEITTSSETVIEDSTETTAQSTTETTTQTTTESTTEVTTTLALEISSDSGRIIVDPTGDDWSIVVVNIDREFTEGYVPTLDEIFDTGYYMDYRVTPYYEEMYTAALADGFTLTPYSAYRSSERQQTNFDSLAASYVSQYGISLEEAELMAQEVILPVGTTEHSLGLAIDIICVLTSFQDTEEYDWLMENAYKYGFILRYPEDKYEITKIVYEPWHWRFVGVEYAEDIYNSGLCMEEYFGLVDVETTETTETTIAADYSETVY
ncbi:MAG: M15 family metallopeptidase [Clostridia bacterium]